MCAVKLQQTPAKTETDHAMERHRRARRLLSKGIQNEKRVVEKKGVNERQKKKRGKKEERRRRWRKSDVF